MLSFSKGERGVMNAAFQRLFNVDTDVLEQQAIQEWMCDAPITVVEYDGSLPKENRKMRDKRMELFDVYDGNIHTLVEFLRQLYPEKKKTSKWELIFSTCNEISSAQIAIEQAITQRAFSQKDVVEEVPQVSEEQLTSQGSSSEVSEEQVQSSTESVGETTVNEEIVSPVPAEEIVEDAKPIEEPITQQVEGINTPTEVEESVMPSGNATKQDEGSLFNTSIKNNKSMEENDMSDVTALLNAANQASAAANPTQEAKAPVSNVKGKDAELDKAKERMAQQYQDQTGARNRWTIENQVTAIVSTQKPAALRTLATEGVCTKETEIDAATTDITAKIVKFITAVSGRDGITIDEFETLGYEERFANVVMKDGDETNRKKAAAMYELLKQMKQNPLGKYAAFIPGADKVSYPTKGFCIGGVPYSVNEFIIQAMENSTGALYGEGSVNAEGKGVGDKPVTFVLGLAKKLEKTKSTGIALDKRTTKVPVIRQKNRKEFINDPSRIVYLFTKEDVENQGKASFKAAINVDGALMGATVSVYALENGQKVIRSTNEKGENTYKTKVASINVSVPVAKIVKEFETRFTTVENEDVLVTAGRWGVQMATKEQKGDFGAVKSISSAPLLDVFAQIYQGTVELNDALLGAGIVNAIKATADAQTAADAAASADELV